MIRMRGHMGLSLRNILSCSLLVASACTKAKSSEITPQIGVMLNLHSQFARPRGSAVSPAADPNAGQVHHVTRICAPICAESRSAKTHKQGR